MDLKNVRNIFDLMEFTKQEGTITVDHLKELNYYGYSLKPPTRGRSISTLFNDEIRQLASDVGFHCAQWSLGHELYHELEVDIYRPIVWTLRESLAGILREERFSPWT